jgi:peptidyl-prolyl cis-trans isomerase C
MMSACQSGGCGSPADQRPPRSEISSAGVVPVNGVEIAPEAIAHEIQHHPAADGDAAWRAAARALVVRELLLNEAARLGIVAGSESDELGRTPAEDEARIAALLERELTPREPSEEEGRRYYEAHLERFRAPDLFEASHILIEPAGAGDAAWANAKAEACAIAESIGNDAAAFAEAARVLSKCPSAKQNGSLGQVRRGELVEPVQSAIESLAEGACTREPVRSKFGWHLLRLNRRIPGRVLPFEAVAGKINEMLAARAWTIAASQYVVRLARQADVGGVDMEPAEC